MKGTTGNAGAHAQPTVAERAQGVGDNISTHAKIVTFHKTLGIAAHLPDTSKKY